MSDCDNVWSAEGDFDDIDKDFSIINKLTIFTLNIEATTFSLYLDINSSEEREPNWY